MWHEWRLNQKINERGLPVDPVLCDDAIAFYKQEKQELHARIQHLTGVSKPSSRDQMLAWFRVQGLPLQDLQAGTLDAVLDHPTDSWMFEKVQDQDLVREVLRLYRLQAMTAPTKWAAFRRNMDPDCRVRGMFIFRGASRTGREASRGINLQNLKRPMLRDPETAVFIIHQQNAEACRLLAGEPMDLLSSSVRAAICAPEGHLLNVVDLANIESRVVGWLTDCRFILDTYRQGRDLYKVVGSEIYGVSEDQITKKQRHFAKPVVLAGPYGQGPAGLVGYAAGMGVQLTEEEAKRHVQLFRSRCPEICDWTTGLWGWLRQAIFGAVRHGQVSSGYRLVIWTEHDFLCIRLPSGRVLFYQSPRIELHEAPWGEMVDTLTYMGQDNRTFQWTRQKAHMGLITENIVQAIARDILYLWMLRLEAAGVRVCGSVHDEVICEEEGDRVDEIVDIAREPPPWGPDLMLDAEGFVTKHYWKD